MKPLTLLGFLLVAATLSAQHDGHWHFGNGFSLDFTDGPVSSGNSDIDVPLNNVPSTISTLGGDLLYFTDGEVIHGANGNLLPDGNLSGSASESLFIPKPGNTDQHYLVRAVGGGIEYYTLDQTLATDGNLVDPDPVNIFSTESRLLSTAKPGLGDDEHWLIALDNVGGNLNVNVFDVTATGIELLNSVNYYFIWVDWFSVLDDVALSPNCDRLAITFKGHYVSLLEFDNETGIVTDPFADALDTWDGFSATSQVVFSPNGQYIYTSGNGTQVRQFDISSWDLATIEGSMVPIDVEGGGTMMNWTDMKCGPDGVLYLIDSNGNKLDAIENPDDTEPSITWGILDPGISMLSLPLTPNITCATVAFFIETGPICLGETAEMTVNDTAEIDNVDWTFGDPAGSTGNGTDVTFEYEDTGSYDVTATVTYGTDVFILEATVEVNTYPDPNIGPDVEICEGETAIFSSGTTAETYTWMDGSDEAETAMSETGWVWLAAANGSCEVTDSAYVEVLPQPWVDCADDIVLCFENEFATVEADADLPITWNNGITESSFETSNAGTYTATVSNACGTVTDEMTVTSVNLATDFLPASAEACFGDTLTLGPLVSLGNANLAWNTGESSETIQVTETGDYTLGLELEGCVSTDVISVNFIDSYPIDLLEMPNVFTPNGDALNRLFRPYSSLNPSLEVCTISTIAVEIQVFNRWGNPLSENACFWDGTVSDGSDAIDGVYYYIVDILNTCGTGTEKVEKSGYVHLMR